MSTPTLPDVERRSIELGGVWVPLVEVTGKGGGPSVTVLAGLHGCEYAAMEGVRRWLRALAGRPLRGRVRAVPVLNVTAFTTRTPFVVPEDGMSLNRCFPGDPGGTLAERIAWDAFTTLICGSDAFLDVHCGDLAEALSPFTLYEQGPAEAQARQLALAYGLPYVIRKPAAPGPAVNGTSAAAAAQAGIPAITTEAGGCGLVSEDAVAMHLAGLDGVLAQLGMIAASDAPPGPRPEPAWLQGFAWARCREGGWWSPAVALGAAVTEGQLLGEVTTLDGAEVTEKVTSPADGVVIFVTSSPAVRDGGVLLGVGS